MSLNLSIIYILLLGEVGESVLNNLGSFTMNYRAGGLGTSQPQHCRQEMHSFIMIGLQTKSIVLYSTKVSLFHSLLFFAMWGVS